MKKGVARADINLMQQFKLLLTGLMVLFLLGWVTEEERSVPPPTSPARISSITVDILSIGDRGGLRASAPAPAKLCARQVTRQLGFRSPGDLTASELTLVA